MTEPVTVVSALSTAFTSIAADASSAIATVLPIALPIMGAIVVIGVGIRVFKRVAGR